MAAVADACDPRFVVLCVRSPIVLGPDSFAWFHVTFTSGAPVIVAKEAESGWTSIAGLIDEAIAAYGADPSRVFVGGFSQGGIMSLAAMLTTPGRIAGAVCMSGRLLPEVLPHIADSALLAHKPVLIVHGTADDKLVIDYARSAREKLTGLGVAMTYQEFPMRHQITDDSLGTVSAWLSARLDAMPTD